MYLIKCDDYTIYDPSNPEMVVTSPSINLEVNKIGSLSFLIYPTHPYFNMLKKMESVITVYQDSKVLFKGRVYSDTVSFYKVKKVEAEGLLAYFNDSIIRPYSFTGSVKEYINFLITQHNEQVSEHQQFKLGKVTVRDSNDYIVRENSNNPDTWSEITDKLINSSLGGYIIIRYEEDGNYIDYLESYTDVSTQSIEYAVNLLDLESVVKGDSLSTCIIPYGMSLSDVTGYQSEEDINTAIAENKNAQSETETKIDETKRSYKNGNYDNYSDYQKDISELYEKLATLQQEQNSLEYALSQWNYTGGGGADERVTIKSVNGGIDYIQNDEAVAKYGKIYEIVTWDDVGKPENLLKKAQEYLQGSIKLTNTLSIKAVDLHLSNEQIEAFQIGDHIQVYSTPHGINEMMMLTSYNLDLSNPTSFQFTLGTEKSSFLDSQINNERTTSDNVNRLDDVSKKLDDTNEKVNKNLQETLQYLNSVIDNSENYIRTLLQDYRKTSDLGDIRDMMSTSYQQTSEEIRMVFEKLQSTITEDMDGVYQEFENITKYIRFVDGDIVLGEVGNDMLTRICNGRISFEHNGIEVAYVKDDKIYITNAEFLDNLIIGNFAFIPRQNGNLSFKYLGMEAT